MTRRAGELSPRQRTALEAILAGRTCAAAASAAGVTERTLFAWRRQPGFVRALQEGQDDIFASSRGDLRATAGDAVKALREIINQESAPASARVRAALGTLEYLHRTVELEEMEARMLEIEDALGILRKPSRIRPAA
jgi:hypothetical protein